MVIASTMKKPEIMVFAGPNGSGKSSVTRLAKLVGVYVNADDIRASLGCSALEAAQIATSKREELVSKRADFTFETVLSTTRNIDLLKTAKEQGYFVRCIYILTTDCEINVSRVMRALPTVDTVSLMIRLEADILKHYPLFRK